jgi:hypothetical protein
MVNPESTQWSTSFSSLRIVMFGSTWALVDKLDVLWRLRHLHDIAVGLNQLHTNEIFHHDVKP